MKNKFVCNCYRIFILLLLFSKLSFAQEEIFLYKDGIPYSKNVEGAKNITNNFPDYGEVRFIVINPSIKVYLPKPEIRNGAAVIICPGGAYFAEATEGEGTEVAKKLCESGIAGIVLNYRLPNPTYFSSKEYVPLQDLQQALVIVRKNAKKWKLNPKKIGVMGSSAGGHLASTAGTHFDKCYAQNPSNISVRPDFMILNYPVISMADSLTHFGSRYSLIGPGVQPGDIEAQRENPVKEDEKYRTAFVTSDMISEFSNELHVTWNTPPTFIVHAVDDSTVKIENSILFIAALQQAGVEVKPFFYAKGGHGFGILNKTAGEQWIDSCIQWIKEDN